LKILLKQFTVLAIILNNSTEILCRDVVMQRLLEVSNNLLARLIHFLATRSPKLKPIWNSSFTFLSPSIICDIEKVFAKKPGFLPDKENQVLSFG
jgi:hypothetical protein